MCRPIAIWHSRKVYHIAILAIFTSLSIYMMHINCRVLETEKIADRQIAG